MSTESRIVLSGAAAGALGGLTAVLVAFALVEPHIDSAIQFENGQIAHDHGGESSGGHSHDTEVVVVSRAVQSTVGVVVSLGMSGVALGLVIAVAAYALGRLIPGIAPRTKVLAAGALALFAGFLVPYVKYPSNPPAVGDDATIVERTLVYFTMVAVSVFAMVVAVVVARSLARRAGWFAASALTLAGYLLVVISVAILLPSTAALSGLDTEIPEGFPADALAGFRLGSVVVAVTLFGVVSVLLALFVGRAESTSAPVTLRPAQSVARL